MRELSLRPWNVTGSQISRCIMGAAMPRVAQRKEGASGPSGAVQVRMPKAAPEFLALMIQWLRGLTMSGEPSASFSIPRTAMMPAVELSAWYEKLIDCGMMFQAALPKLRYSTAGVPSRFDRTPSAPISFTSTPLDASCDWPLLPRYSSGLGNGRGVKTDVSIGRPSSKNCKPL